MAVDVFQNDDRVVYDHPRTQHEPDQRHCVDGHADQVHEDQRAEERKRNAHDGEHGIAKTDDGQQHEEDQPDAPPQVRAEHVQTACDNAARVIGDVQRDQGRFAEAEATYRRALDLRERVLGPNAADVAETLSSYADLLRKMGRTAEADRLGARATAIEAGN